MSRDYDTHEEYIEHQGGKLNNYSRYVESLDKKYEGIVMDRYQGLFKFKGKSMVCLGARLGGEVKAFKRLGALAIGIDINPGEKNEHVLYGDFHEIKFENRTFDFIFCNAIDHVLYMDVFLDECARVLKPKGVMLFEVAIQAMGDHEVIDTQDIEPIKKALSESFTITQESDINNGWDGKLLILVK